MFDELEAAIKIYQSKWKRLVAACQDKRFFESLKPIAVAWKIADLGDFDNRFADVRDHCSQIHLGWLDNRWLATMYLKDISLSWNIHLVKLMQRRPQSTDALGLDHIDFLLPESTDIKAILQKESHLKWSEEHGDYTHWFSLWFNGAEAKLRFVDSTTPAACIREFQEVNNAILDATT